MNVKKLIEALQKLDPNMTVYAEDPDLGMGYEVDEVKVDSEIVINAYPKVVTVSGVLIS
jgi:hypothetical protein